MVLESPLRAVTGGHHLPVLLIELPSRKEEVERWRATISKFEELGYRRDFEFILAPDESQASAFLQAAGAPGLANEDVWGHPPIFGAQSLDDAMEQALRYLNLPT
jgi:hypothetical protein